MCSYHSLVGTFFTNYQVHTQDIEACIKAATTIVKSRALVTQPESGWISIYDETSELQDSAELQRVASELSEKLATEVFAFLVHDSDVFVYWFYRKGKLVDQFNSNPNYFGPMKSAERKKWAGQFQKLAPIILSAGTPEQLQKKMERKHVFHEELTREFAKATGIDPDRACTGFEYLRADQHGFRLIQGEKYSPDSAALGESVEAGNLEQVRALLLDKVSPNGKNRIGEPLLAAALRCGRTEIAVALLEAGADPYSDPKADALWAAVAHNNQAILKLLLQRPSEQLEARLPTALMNAVVLGHVEIVEDLLNGGAKPNVANEQGNTPLMAACCRGVEAIWEAQTGRRFSDHPRAKRTDWPALVNILLKAGADVNARDKNGVTALLVARASGQQNIVDMLLKSGADPNPKLDPQFVKTVEKQKKKQIKRLPRETR
jgi:hypothetical protein